MTSLGLAEVAPCQGELKVIWRGEQTVGERCAYVDMEQRTGRYFCLCSGGLKKEGSPIPAWYPTEKDALLAYNNQLGPITRGKSRIIWREAPSMQECSIVEFTNWSGSHEKLYSVYSRLWVE